MNTTETIKKILLSNEGTPEQNIQKAIRFIEDEKYTHVRVQEFEGVRNQFIIYDETDTIFQSYNSIIAIKRPGLPTILGKNWNYSRTTGKYRDIFLNETKKETEDKIKSGEYILDETI